VEPLAVFSTNASLRGPTGSRPCTCYGKFAAYTLLNHNGDFQAAARELAEQGYGERRGGAADTAGVPAGGEPDGLIYGEGDFVLTVSRERRRWRVIVARGGDVSGIAARPRGRQGISGDLVRQLRDVTDDEAERWTVPAQPDRPRRARLARTRAPCGGAA
jgi:hypothetical protein